MVFTQRIEGFSTLNLRVFYDLIFLFFVVFSPSHHLRPRRAPAFCSSLLCPSLPLSIPSSPSPSCPAPARPSGRRTLGACGELGLWKLCFTFGKGSSHLQILQTQLHRLAIFKLQLQLSNYPSTLTLKITVFSHENAGIWPWPTPFLLLSQKKDTSFPSA